MQIKVIHDVATFVFLSKLYNAAACRITIFCLFDVVNMSIKADEKLILNARTCY